MIVTDIGYGQWLDAPAAASFFRVCAAIGRRLDVNEAGRTWEQQNKFRQDYLNGVPGAAFALPAGTSIHEQGRAIDTDDRFIDLMRDHGWIRTALARNEPWHFEYFIDQDNHRHEGVPSSGTAVAFPGGTAVDIAIEIEEDHSMKLLYTKDYGGDLWTLLNEATGVIVEQSREQERANSWAQGSGSAKVCTVQAFLDHLAAVEISTRPDRERQIAILAALGESAAREDKLQDAIDDIKAQIADGLNPDELPDPPKA